MLPFLSLKAAFMAATSFSLSSTTVSLGEACGEQSYVSICDVLAQHGEMNPSRVTKNSETENKKRESAYSPGSCTLVFREVSLLRRGPRGRNPPSSGAYPGSYRNF